MAALKRLAAPAAVVVRDGATAGGAAEVLVPGDIVLLEAGNMVPGGPPPPGSRRSAAGRSGTHRGIDACREARGRRDDPAPAVADRDNMTFKGTVVAVWPWPWSCRCDRHGDRTRADRGDARGYRRCADAAAAAARPCSAGRSR